MAQEQNPKTLRRQLLSELQAVIESTQQKITPLLQQEARDLAEEKLEQFHRSNPHQHEVAAVLYKGLRKRHKRNSVCTHVKGLEHPLLDALGYERDIPGPTHPDYNIVQHIFPDGTYKAWCVVCGDTFTAKEVRELFTTNTISSSERIIESKDKFYTGEPKLVGTVEGVS